MKLRLLAPLACLTAILCVSGCDSSDSSPTSSNGNKVPKDSGETPNGTLTVNGKAFPAFTTGLFDDTSLTMTINADLNTADTGWSFMLSSKPSVGTHPYREIMFGIVGHHHSAKPDTCSYAAESATTSSTLTAWTPGVQSGYEMAKMSGSVNLSLTPWKYETGDCPDATVSVTFTNADAINWNVVDEVLD